VPTRGVAEYLRQYLTRECQLAANLQMPFPDSFINTVMRRIYGADYSEAEQRSKPEYIRNQVMKLLSGSYIAEQLPELSGYTKGENQELRRWQLADKIADVFDHYQLYRTKELEAMFGKFKASAGWQKKLYDQLFDSKHPGRDHFFRQFLQQGLNGRSAALLPPMINIFGMGAMPPVYLDIFVKLSKYTQVNFFYLAPCLEYWEYQESPRKCPKPAAWEEPESGNPLIQSLGRQGRSFFAALMNLDECSSDLEPPLDKTPDGYPPQSSMLEIMQYDMLYLFCHQFDPARDDKLACDGSIRIHNCHSLRRELEVLQDELIRIIRNGTLPQDIIVMMPDVERSAPLIHAVFGNGVLKDVYSIADLPPDDSRMINEAFHRLLATATGHLEFSEIISLLDLQVFANLLQLKEGDLNKLAQYLQQADVRWGFDRNMRQKFCGSAFDEYSWQSAFDRLLTGYACRVQNADDTPTLLGGINILEALDTSEIEVFSRLVLFVQNLAKLADDVAKRQSIREWCRIFSNMIGNFFSFADNNLMRAALMPLYRAIEDLKKLDDDNCTPGVYPLNAALAMLDSMWKTSGETSRFLHGKITFCRMTPMRSIPMQTVVLMELNEGEYPRKNHQVGFDLIPMDPHLGDRSISTQDRYLLLEALLAARKNLLLFYQGQNARDNSERPPCAALGEIMDYLQKAFDLREIKHKVSGINVMYYKADQKCLSFDQQNYEALQLQCQTGSAAYIRESTDDNAMSSYEFYGLPRNREMELDSLVDFFSNPARYIVCNQLGGNLPKAEEELSDNEPFALDNLSKWQLENMLLNMRRQQINDTQTYEYARSGNLLPPGRSGRREFEQCSSQLPPLPPEIVQILDSLQRMPFTAQLQWDNAENWTCTLHGMVNIKNDMRTVCAYRWGKYDARTALPAVLGVYLAAAASDQPIGGEIFNLGSAGCERRCILPVAPEAARQKLKALLELAWQVHLGALEIFPGSSPWAHDPAQAAKKFYSSGKNFAEYGDVTNVYIQKFFRKENWSEETFQQNFLHYAQLLYGDIIEPAEGTECE